MKSNDVILHTVTKFSAVIILTFSIHLFIAGHHQPGGGFIGGLTTASGIVLLLLAFDIDTIKNNIRVNFINMAVIGVIIAVLTGMLGLIDGEAFLTQSYGDFNLPIFGDTELATAVLFDTGVALAVIGTAVSIIISISEDAN
mgnify:CR=1 FL=1